MTITNRYRVRKMLVIGLGGTGRDAVLNIKRKYLEAYGRDSLPTTEFLVFDTADPKPLVLQDQRELALKPGEFFKMSVANPQLVVQVNHEVKEWFPRDGVPMRSITRGAGQVRAVGRLALYHNAAEVYRRIKTALDRLNSLKPHEPLGDFEPVNDSVLINVVGSLSGGTGSGTFIDIAYLCRHHMRPSSDLLSAYLLLPDVFVGRPGTDNVEPNAYAAMTELDMLMERTTRAADEKFRFGGEEISMGSHPFDVVYLVNNRNKRGQVFQEVAELTELMGMGIFIASGAAGQDAGDVWDNLRFQIPPADGFGKTPHYASFGAAELVFDTDRYAEEQKDRIAARAIAALVSGPGERRDEGGMAEIAAQFVAGLGLGSHDLLVAQLDPARDVPPFRKTESGTFRQWQDEFAGKDGFVDRQVAGVQSRMQEKLAEVQQGKALAIRDRTRALAAEPHGLRRALAFLQYAGKALDEQRMAALAAREDQSTARRFTSDRVGQGLVTFRQQQRWMGWLWRRGRVTDAADNVSRSITQETQQAVASARFDAAATVLASAVTECAELARSLQELERRLETIGGQLRNGIAEAEREAAPIRPFTIELPFPAFLRDDQRIEPGELLQWLRTADRDLFDLAQVRNDDELREFFRDFAATRESVKKIRAQDLDELFRAKVYDVQEQVRLLDNVAEPLWQYETAYLNGGHRTHTIYVFGVRSADNTVFQADEVAKMLSSSQSIQPAATNDPHRVFCYKVEAAVPAFVLERMSRYRYRYQMRPGFYHADQRWADAAPDLWPSLNGNGNHAAASKAYVGPVGIVPDPAVAAPPPDPAQPAQNAAAAQDLAPRQAAEAAEPSTPMSTVEAAPEA